MQLFHDKILTKAIGNKTPGIPGNHLKIITDWKDRIKSGSLKKKNEIQIYDSFSQLILQNLLGYTIYGSDPEWTLSSQHSAGRGAVDIAIGHFCDDPEKCRTLAPFEIKGAKTKSLDDIMPDRHKSPVDQAWEYANDIRGAEWVLVSNYVEIRLYSVRETRSVYEQFFFVDLINPEIYARFMLLLSAENFLTGKTAELLDQSLLADKDITSRLYDDYKILREKLIVGLIVQNPQKKPFDLIAPAQKLLDRFLFLVFAEDKGLIPMQSVQKAFEHDDPYNPRALYDNFKGLFRAINQGSSKLSIPAYNGGLFAQDDELDNLSVSDEICQCINELAKYDFDSDISVTVLGHIFEQSISDLENIFGRVQEGIISDPNNRESKNKKAVYGKRKRQGVVYTPDHITHFIVEHTLGRYINELFSTLLTDYGTIKDEGSKDEFIKWKRGKNTELNFWQAWQTTLKGIKVVDPACGSGAFLVAAFTFLYDQYQKVNSKLADLSGGQYSLFDLNKEILTNNLFGVDINPESVEITKLSLWLKTAEKGKPLTSLDNNIVTGNSLGLKKNVPGDSFSWQTAFSEIMKAGGFDIVLGNPPYVRQERISDIKPWLEQNFQVYHGVADLYTYFFEVGHKLLKPGGKMGYISSSTFFKTGSGQSLRKYISEKTSLDTIIDFGDMQIFEGVTTYPAIVIAKNTATGSDHKFKLLSLVDSLPDNLLQYFIQNCGEVDQSQLGETSWQLEDKRFAEIRKKLTLGHKTLKEVYGSPLYGIKTGLNEAFVIDGNTRKELIDEDPNSHDLIKPFLEGKDLKKWHAQPRDLWLIAIPKFWTRHHMGKDQNEIINEDEAWDWLQKEQSAICNWLEPFAEKARNRTDKGEFWWELRACAYYQLFSENKIFYPDITDSQKFHIDDSKAFSGNTGYFIPINNYYVIALLNSILFWFLLKGYSDSVRGGFYRMFSQNIIRLPIPNSTREQQDSIGCLAEQCQSLSKTRYTIENNLRKLLLDFCLENHDIKLNNKLHQWWLLDFKQLREEIKKQFKADIPLSERTDWMDLFEKNKKIISDLNRQIALNEKEINSEVYKLFHLADEEISLIESNI